MASKLSTQETLYFNRLSRLIIKRIPPKLMCALYNFTVVLIFVLEKYHYDSPNRSLSALAQRTGITYDLWIIGGFTIAFLLVSDRHIRRVFAYYVLTVLFILVLIIASYRQGTDVTAFVLSSWYTLLMPFMLFRGLVQEIALYNAIEQCTSLTESVNQFRITSDNSQTEHG